MQMDFSLLLSDGIIKVNGCPFKLGTPQAVKAESGNYRMEFLSDGSVNLTVKGYENSPRAMYVKNNDLMRQCFKNMDLQLKVTEIDNGTGYAAFMKQDSVTKDSNGDKVKRSLYIENCLYRYKDGTDTTEGIYIYYFDVPLKR